ncbi:hypothetical protein VspDsh1_37 [Vibrio phage VspDsh_1]|nr:hypothetical protein VspDsh1_37 [Vibrio phage VspDsh_1]
MATVKAYNSSFWVQLIPDPPTPTARPYVFGPGVNHVSKGSVQQPLDPTTGKTVKKYGSFWELFQNSVFVTPSTIALGVTADSSTWEIEMWHTHLGVVTISDIVKTGARGMTLSRQGGGVQDTLPWNGYVKYNLHIGLQTDTTIEANFTWSLSPSMRGATVKVTGSRVVPWPYLPSGEYTETREWLTDVIRTRKKEQRLSLRRGPRKTVSQAYQLSDTDLSNMWSHSRVWVNQTYAVPNWNKYVRVGPIAKGVTELTFNNVQEKGFTASGFAFIYDNNETYEVRPIKGVTTTKLTFVDGVSRAYNDATVVVIELQKHEHPIQISRTAYGVSRADVTWEVVDDTKNASNLYPLYSGKPVVIDRVVMGGTSQSEQFGYDIDRIDNKVGLYTDFQEYDWESRTRAQLRWSCDTETEFEAVRNFLDFCRGKQGEFWVPTWNRDFLLHDNIAAGTLLAVKPTTAALFFKEFHMMIQLVDGTRRFVKATAASKGTTHDSFTVTPSMPDILMTDVEFICRINLMRFDTDRFEFQRKATGVIDIAAPIISVPEV